MKIFPSFIDVDDDDDDVFLINRIEAQTRTGNVKQSQRQIDNQRAFFVSW